MRIGVQETGSRRTAQEEPLEEGSCEIPLSLRSFVDDHRQWSAIDPLGDDDVRSSGENVWNEEVGIALEGSCVSPLVLRLAKVVEFLGDTVTQLVDEWLDLDTGNPRGKHLAHSGELVEVGHECLVGARVLDLDGHDPTVVPCCLMDLSDGRGCRRYVVELGEPRPPIVAELLAEDLVDA